MIPRLHGLRTLGAPAARSSLLLLGGVLLACSPSGGAPSDERPFTLLYTGDAQGYLEACACSTGGELGGIARRAALVDSLRRKSEALLLVEAGDFAGGPGPRGELAGRVAAEAMRKMQYDAVLPGEVELNLGPGFWDKVKGLRLPFVHTNFGTPELGPPQSEPLVVERGGRKIAILGLLGPDLYFLPPLAQKLQILPPLEAAGAALKRLESRDVDLIVAVVHLRAAEVDSLAARYPQIGVFVAGHRSTDLEQPERHGSALLVSAGFLGQHLGALELSGPDLKVASNRDIRIETTLPEDPQIAEWVEVTTKR